MIVEFTLSILFAFTIDQQLAIYLQSQANNPLNLDKLDSFFDVP